MEGTVRLDVRLGGRGAGLSVGLGSPWRDVRAMILALFSLETAQCTYLDEDEEQVSIDTDEEYGEALKVACAQGYVLQITVHHETSSSGTDDFSSGGGTSSSTGASASAGVSATLQESASVSASHQQSQHDDLHRHHHHHHHKHHKQHLLQHQQQMEQHQQQMAQHHQQVQQFHQQMEQHHKQVQHFQQQVQQQQQQVQQQQQQFLQQQVNETPLATQWPDDVARDVAHDGPAAAAAGGDGGATDGFPAPPGTPPPWFQEYMEKFREKLVVDVTVQVTRELRESLVRELAGGGAAWDPPGQGQAPPGPPGPLGPPPPHDLEEMAPKTRDAKQHLLAEKELLRFEKHRLRAEKKQHKAEFREIKRQLGLQRYGRAWVGAAAAAAAAGDGAAGRKKPRGAERGFEEATEAPAAVVATRLVAPSHIPALAYVNAVFVEENLPDGTHVQPDTRFIKHWRMCNTGNVAWDSRTALQLLWGNLHVAASTGREVSAPFLAPGTTGTLSVEFVAPATEGTFTSHWRLAHEGRPFGPRVWVTVVVAGPPPGAGAPNSPTRSLYSAVRSSRKELSFELLLPAEEQKVPSNTPVAVSPRASPLPEDHDDDEEEAVLLEAAAAASLPCDSRAEEELSGTEFVFETVIRSLTLEESPEPRPRRDTRHGSSPAPPVRSTPMKAAKTDPDDEERWHDAPSGPPGAGAAPVARDGEGEERVARYGRKVGGDEEEEEDGDASQSSDDYVVVLPECFDTSRPLSLEEVIVVEEMAAEGSRASREATAAVAEEKSEAAEGGTAAGPIGGAAEAGEVGTGSGEAVVAPPVEGTVDEMLWGPPAGGAVPLTPLSLHGKANGRDGAQRLAGDGAGPPGNAGDRTVPEGPHLAAPYYINNALTLASSALRTILRGRIDTQNGHGEPVAPSPMATLLEMGFGDRALNARLLREHAGDLNAVVPALLAANDNDWHSTRH